MTAHFITLEGIEGVGKSTQLKFIADYLAARKIPLVTTREPGGTPLAEDIRSLLLDPRTETVSVDTELLLIFASRAQHIAQVIQPALASNHWVISDRFIDATYAYQGGGRGISSARIDELVNWTLGNLRPQLTFLLDMPVTLSMQRTKDRGLATDRFESERMQFFMAVRAAYLQRARAEPQRIKVIDASLPIQAVQTSIQTVLAQHCKVIL